MMNNNTVSDEPNPYQASVSKPEQPRPMGVVGKIILLTISCGCLLVASGLFVFAESFDTYTPYSAEKHWIMMLPNGSGMWIDARTGMAILISSLVVGISLMLWALAPIRMNRHNRLSEPASASGSKESLSGRFQSAVRLKWLPHDMYFPLG